MSKAVTSRAVHQDKNYVVLLREEIGKCQSESKEETESMINEEQKGKDRKSVV